MAALGSQLEEHLWLYAEPSLSMQLGSPLASETSAFITPLSSGSDGIIYTVYGCSRAVFELWL